MRPALLLGVLALALAACGAAPRDSAKDFQGDERAVASAVEDLESAAKRRRQRGRLHEAARPAPADDDQGAGHELRHAVEDAFQDADAKDLTVDDVTISGTTASAKVTSGTGNKKKTEHDRAREGRRRLADLLAAGVSPSSLSAV